MSSSTLPLIGRLPWLHKAVRRNKMLSNIGFIVNGITPNNIWNCFNFKIILSTFDLKLTSFIWSKSRTKKPLSAVTALFSSSRFIRLEFPIMFLLDTGSVQRGRINEMIDFCFCLSLPNFILWNCLFVSYYIMQCDLLFCLQVCSVQIYLIGFCFVTWYFALTRIKTRVVIPDPPPPPPTNFAQNVDFM